MAVPDNEFATMKARARSFRRRIDELGAVSGPVIEVNVRTRLCRPSDVSALPPAQGELADEIVALLACHGESCVSSKHELQQTFFGQYREGCRVGHPIPNDSG